MSPMEGCPTAFQVVCNLAPGYHEYKFCVDGEWRHDEHQPFVTGSGGVVNAIIIAGGQDMVPIGLNTETLGRSNMEVDDVVMRMGNPSQDFIPRMSRADVEVSRHRISEFLSKHTAYELLPESGKVIALDVNLPVKQAFHILYEQGIPLAPLWDFSKGQFVGVLGPLDFILILRELGTHGSNLTEEELEMHTIAAWKEGKAHISRQLDGNGRPYPRPLVQARPSDYLNNVAKKILENKVATVPIIHSSSSDDSYPQLLHLASLSGILKCICRYFRNSSSSLPILQQPICSIPLGTWVPSIGESTSRPLATLKPHASLGSALSLLVQAEVSSIPIVDDNDSLIDIYSRSDITALAKDKAYAQIHLDDMTIHRALQLGQDAYPLYGFVNGQRCHMCLRSDSLQKVMERLANPGVRRLVIVEPGSKRVEGIISVSDVFRFLLAL
ncbi:PREDICTED: sucrose nonfermenting 4-like protein isoform X2 [Tarenaya hassleriana]|nr:PREDICTED: sucrose nonfermenting 4-like protein isoform X2 [Tarenaya hassleriana]